MIVYVHALLDAALAWRAATWEEAQTPLLKNPAGHKMKFSTRQDTDLPAEALFAAISNFDAIARMLTRRGAVVRLQNATELPETGMSWLIGFDFRGRSRELTMELTAYQPPELIQFRGHSEQFELTVRMTVVGLTRSKSRLIFETDAQPRGMKARLLLQTAKLGKPQLDRKFAERIGDFVNSLSASGLA